MRSERRLAITRSPLRTRGAEAEVRASGGGVQLACGGKCLPGNAVIPEIPKPFSIFIVRGGPKG